MNNIKDFQYYLSEKKGEEKPKEMVKRGSLVDVEKEEAKSVKKVDIEDIKDDKKGSKGKGKSKKAPVIKRLGLGDIKEEFSVLEAKNKNYMFFQNIKHIRDMANELCVMSEEKIDSLLSEDHGWASDHIATSKDDIEEVYSWLKSEIEK
jgi:hypothetical protein